MNSPPAKRQCTGDNNNNSDLSDVELLDPSENGALCEVVVKATKASRVQRRCQPCGQWLDDVTLFSGDPAGSQDELVCLTDHRISLFENTDAGAGSWDERPQHKITNFSVYCSEGHLCPFDSGLVERNVELFFSGYLKSLDSEDGSILEDGVPACRLGPIDEWWLAGFDGGENVVIALATAYADYVLMLPAMEYAPMMNAAREKVYLTKVVMEFLSQAAENEADNSSGDVLLDSTLATYADLLDYMTTCSAPQGCAFTEENLHRHSQFLLEQVQFLDEENGTQHFNRGCVQTLQELAGVQLETGGRQKRNHRSVRIGGGKKAAGGGKGPVVQHSKATVTPLVRALFDSLFDRQLDEDVTDKKVLSMIEFQEDIEEDINHFSSCLQTKPNKGKSKAQDSHLDNRDDNLSKTNKTEEEEEVKGLLTSPQHQHKFGRKTGSRVEWVGEPSSERGSRKFYQQVRLNGLPLNVGDCVRIESDESSIPFYVAKVVTMWQSSSHRVPMLHASFFYRGQDTVLGDTSDLQELFLVDECEDCELSCCIEKVEVEFKPPPANWSELGGTMNTWSGSSPNSFFYQKRYLPQLGRYQDPSPDHLPSSTPSGDDIVCPVCRREKADASAAEPRVDLRLKRQEDEEEGTSTYAKLFYLGREFSVGGGVYLPPGTLKKKVRGGGERFFHALKRGKENNSGTTVSAACDENLYPEKYRKTSAVVKGSNDGTPEPFDLGIIKTIVKRRSGTIVIRVGLVLRAAQRSEVEDSGGRVLLTEEVMVVEVVDKLVGQCWIVHEEDLDEINICKGDYFTSGNDRFFYSEYLSSACDTPFPITRDCNSPDTDLLKAWYRTYRADSHRPKPLATLDVFAGCGGLSEGLHQSGVAQTRWAIERCPQAAAAFKLNNPVDCEVFTEDCNTLLKLAIQGHSTNSQGQAIPQRGDVQLLCGGPPCQGFSGMNRFNRREYSTFKNSLVASYLSYCDFYRPRFFLLENVRNFLSFKRSMILRLTLRCLLTMGYQVSFGVLQAGSYGVPQTRRRCIIMAAAPGEVFPNYPEPQYTFSPRGLSLTVQVEDSRFECPFPRSRLLSAPHRSVTVKDALSDLPPVRNGASRLMIDYTTSSDVMTPFQRQMRSNETEGVLRDHICKEMSALVAARMERIPRTPGSDWRDLPNLAVRINSDTVSKILRYTHPLCTGGISSQQQQPGVQLKGVCTCSLGKGNKCDPSCRQFDTLIPWCLPHTGDRHNNWAGLYGRLNWEGHFSTTITNPEPMGKQGRVLHPTQNRVVSVRECARSQGFPDHYQFTGSVLDKHRQVGNAVPPPMARAIGLELLKSLGHSP